MPKSPFASKTLWFNALTIVIAVASAHGWTPDQELAETAATLLVALSPFVNMILRFFTKKPIAVTK